MGLKPFPHAVVSLLLLTVLACRVGSTPAPPPAITATALPLPTVALPTLAVPTVTPLAVATNTPTETPVAAMGAIGGWVWHDLCDPGPEGEPGPSSPPPGCSAGQFGGYRANGMREANEPGISGVVVRLGLGACPSTGLAEGSTATAGPSYVFDGLQPGIYCVSVDPFAAANSSQMLPGRWTYPGLADGLLGQTVSVGSGQSLLDVSFGWDYQFLPPAAGPTPSTAPATPTSPTPATPGLTATPARLRPGSTFHAPRLAAPPTLDGGFGDWAGLPYALTTPAYRPENWTGVNDQSAAFALGWDDVYLYLAIHVTDDAYVQTQTGDTLFRGDSLELLVDANLVGDFDDGQLSGDDFQLGLSAGANRITPEAYLWFPAANRGRPLGLVMIPRPDSAGQGYQLEAAIPWSVLGISPATGSHFGFVLSSSDNDSPGTAEQQSMLSSEAGRRLTNPTTWGTLILDP